jgi:hypothetical protein
MDDAIEAIDTSIVFTNNTDADYLVRWCLQAILLGQRYGFGGTPEDSDAAIDAINTAAT